MYTPLASLLAHTTQFVLSEDDIIDVEGVGYEPVGDFTVQGRSVSSRASYAITAMLKAACLCNNAVLGDDSIGSLRSVSYSCLYRLRFSVEQDLGSFHCKIINMYLHYCVL